MTRPYIYAPSTSATPEACDPEGLHRDLAHWNRRRLAVGTPHGDWDQELKDEHRMRWMEALWIEAFREEVAELAADAPEDADGFVHWFETLRETGPGQGDPLFTWLAYEADLAQMRWFLEQEAAGEAGFDDLVALTQVKMPLRPKLELAQNYWDEMGRGQMGGVHSLLLAQTGEGLGLNPSIDETAWEPLALANTLTAFATTRRYAYQAVGALGAVELTAPGRVALVSHGLKRLGCAPETRKYFALHAQLDIEHSRAWNAEVLHPLVAEQAGCARFLAEGALMRLVSGARCFQAYRDRLWAAGPAEAERRGVAPVAQEMPAH